MDESRLVRNVEELLLSPRAMELARELIRQIDMQVIFLIDAQEKNNCSGRHPMQGNQFWVTVKPQAEAQEFDRLVLAGLYRGIQERKRYRRIWYRESYVESLQNPQHGKVYMQFVDFLGSFLSSLDTELFLEQYGITTSQAVLQKKYDTRMQGLEEYIAKRRRMPGFAWYRETEVWNLLEYGNLWQRCYAWKKQIKSRAAKVNPRYVDIIERIAFRIQDMRVLYNGENGAELMEQMEEYIVSTFHLEEMVRFYTPRAHGAVFYFQDGENAQTLEYIPEDIPHQDQLFEWFEEAGRFLNSVRELAAYRIPDVTFWLVRSDRSNAYADHKKDMYQISFTTGLTEQMNRWLERPQVCEEGNAELLRILGEDDYRKRLKKTVIDFITAHEYAHILHEDDKKARTASEPERRRMEEAADQTAEKLVKWEIPAAYRLSIKPEDQMERFGEAFWRMDAKEAMEVIDSVPPGRKQEMEEEMGWLLEQCRRDELVLRDAIVQIEEFRRKEKENWSL